MQKKIDLAKKNKEEKGEKTLARKSLYVSHYSVRMIIVE